MIHMWSFIHHCHIIYRHILIIFYTYNFSDTENCTILTIYLKNVNFVTFCYESKFSFPLKSSSAINFSNYLFNLHRGIPFHLERVWALWIAEANTLSYSSSAPDVIALSVNDFISSQVFISAQLLRFFNLYRNFSFYLERVQPCGSTR